MGSNPAGATILIMNIPQTPDDWFMATITMVLIVITYFIAAFKLWFNVTLEDMLEDGTQCWKIDRTPPCRK